MYNYTGITTQDTLNNNNINIFNKNVFEYKLYQLFANKLFGILMKHNYYPPFGDNMSFERAIPKYHFCKLLVTVLKCTITAQGF